MALNNVSELSETPASNPDLAGISILGTGLVSTADDSFRTAASFLKKWWDDLGGVNTVAGTGDAITVTTLTVYTAYKTGMRLVWIQGSANTTAVTLNLDAIGAKAVRKISGGVDVALVAGDLPAGARIEAVYSTAANAAAGGWVILSVSVATATTSTAGIVQLATVAEAATGTNATKAVTPAGLYFPTGHLSGLGLTNSGADSIVIAAGTARSSDDTTNITLPSSLTKSVAVAWAVGSAQGGLDTGAVANADYYLWLVERVDTFVVDAVFSTSGTAPTLPTNYTKKALIGKFTRAAATNQAPRSYADDRLGPTAWVAYTPTFTGWGTASVISFYSRRVGDTLEVKGTWTAGTTTGTEARITLGFSGTSANVTSDATKASVLQNAGYAFRNTTGQLSVGVLIEPSVSYMTFSSTNDNGLNAVTKTNGSSFPSSTIHSLRASFPISGW